MKFLIVIIESLILQTEIPRDSEVLENVTSAKNNNTEVEWKNP